MQRLPMLLVLSLTTLLSTQAAAQFDAVECLSNNSKAECTRQLLIDDALSKPLSQGDEVLATSEKYSVTVHGEDWLRNGYGANQEKAKDLGLIKGSGVGRLDIEKSTVQKADFESTITTDMQGIYEGLQQGFKKGKITISSNSELEILPLTVTGSEGLLGRFCYTIEAGNKKSVCVYEGFVANTEGSNSFKLLGSIGDYDNMRTELESIITSFTFKN